MYYSNGNYEAFARPKKPEGVDSKNAYIIGTGLAALSAACYLVRDAQMPGDHIHVFEKDAVPGGACDGANIPGVGYVMRGGREMDNHFEVMWDLFRSIPSVETEGVSVLDEYYWLNKEDPNYSLCRSTRARGIDAGTNGKFALTDKASMEIMKLFFTPNEELYGKKISDFFDDEVFDSNFWMYWRTMFAFENWHSALEMKLYIKRYIHHIGGLPDFSALRFTRYNQYESMILPMIAYLEGFGVQFHYNVKVDNVEFKIGGRHGPCAPAHRRRTGHDSEEAGRIWHVRTQSVQLADQKNGHAHRPDRSRRRDPHDRFKRQRSGVHHQRRLRGKLLNGLTDRTGQVGSTDPPRWWLGHVAPHRQAGSELWPS